MRRQLIGLCLTLATCEISSGAEPFHLQLPGHASVWFPSGSVIRIPTEPCGEFMVKLSAPFSREFSVDQLELSLNGRYPLTARLTGSEGHVLRTSTREALGLFPNKSHKVAVAADGRSKLTGWWSVFTWDRPYVESTKSSREGAPIAISLDQPVGGVIHRIGTSTVRLAGEVTGPATVRLAADGVVISRLPNKPGFAFDKEISLQPGAKAVILRAEDQSGAETTITLPVAQ